MRDSSIPDKHRREFISRRRQRELITGPTLALDQRDLRQSYQHNDIIETSRILELLRAHRYRYDDPKNANPHSVFLWSFVTVIRDRSVLSYRLGRYRDNRDSFVNKRSIGITNVVREHDQNLFSLKNYGILESGFSAVAVDLDIPLSQDPAHPFQAPMSLCCFLCPNVPNASSDIAALVRYECPEWYEPTRRHLAMNELQWLDLDVVPNNLDDFDPWSRIAIAHRWRILTPHRASAEYDFST